LVVILLIVLVISIYGLANFYVGLRGWQLLGSFIPFMNNKVYWIIFWFIATSFILVRISSSFLPTFIRNIISLIGSYWMAVLLYSLILLVLIDIVRLISKLFGYKPSWMTFSNQKSSFVIGILLLSIISGIIIWGTWNAVNVKIRHYDIDINKKAGQIENLHIVLISDIHLGYIVNNKRLEGMVDKINSLNPDLVLLVGDTIDDNIEPYIKQNMAETFRKLHPKLGVYAVLGNHEFYGSKPPVIVKNFEEGNIKVLRDQYVKMDGGFYLVGREDLTNKKRETLNQNISGIDKTLPIILMDHQPVKLEEPEKEGVDLQLSGHTHGGQLFPARIINHLIYADDWGYLRKDNFQLIVSSGAGTWGPPIRIGSDSEIVDINVRFK